MGQTGLPTIGCRPFRFSSGWDLSPRNCNVRVAPPRSLLHARACVCVCVCNVAVFVANTSPFLCGRGLWAVGAGELRPAILKYHKKPHQRDQYIPDLGHVRQGAYERDPNQRSRRSQHFLVQQHDQFLVRYSPPQKKDPPSVIAVRVLTRVRVSLSLSLSFSLPLGLCCSNTTPTGIYSGSCSAASWDFVGGHVVTIIGSGLSLSLSLSLVWFGWLHTI
jgi:hypothetical protein